MATEATVTPGAAANAAAEKDKPSPTPTPTPGAETPKSESQGAQAPSPTPAAGPTLMDTFVDNLKIEVPDEPEPEPEKPPTTETRAPSDPRRPGETWEAYAARRELEYQHGMTQAGRELAQARQQLANLPVQPKSAEKAPNDDIFGAPETPAGTNPEVAALRAELNGLRAQLNSLQPQVAESAVTAGMLELERQFPDKVNVIRERAGEITEVARRYGTSATDAARWVLGGDFLKSETEGMIVMTPAQAKTMVRKAISDYATFTQQHGEAARKVSAVPGAGPGKFPSPAAGAEAPTAPSGKNVSLVEKAWFQMMTGKPPGG